MDIEPQRERPISDTEIIMNSQGVIEVQPDGLASIHTRSLIGCLAIAGIVEDDTGIRRCGLAHWDPMSLALELDRDDKLTTLIGLMNKTAEVDTPRLTKHQLIVLSQDPNGQQRKFIQPLLLEAKYLLGCEPDEITVVDYRLDGTQSQSLSVLLKGSKIGNPEYCTKREKVVLPWDSK